jgi:FAD/FMN-containing dehydrogenase
MQQSALRSQAVSVTALRSAVTGRVIGPGEADYDESRQVFNAAVDRRPAAVVRPADAADVAFVVTLARAHGLELAVRGGGHSMAGHGTSDGGIVLDLSDMRELDIDPQRRTAWAQAGLTAGEYTTAAARHGLATGFGDTGTVGIAGITLGGGIGWLVRKHGLTVDDLLAVELVTAGGDLLHVDAATHPDLFWALRGGGGNFGVVTRLKYRLHEVDRVLGGMVILPASPDILRAFVSVAGDAPDELSTIAQLAPLPPLPFVAPEHHGQLGLMVSVVHAGDIDAGQRAVAPIRALATPIADTTRPMPYPEMYEDGGPPGRPKVAVRSMFMDDIDARVAGTIFEHLRAAPPPMAMTQIRVLGGAMARIPAHATAFAHRDRRMMVTVAAMHLGPGGAAVQAAWADGLLTALRPSASGAFVNFMGAEGAARVREAYPGGAHARLTAVKRRYDPTNLFRLNQNIAPSPA